jgi:hypothetical protein
MHQHNQRGAASRILLCLVASVLSGGCSQLDLTAPKMPWQKDDEELVKPEKIVAFWSDTVLHQTGRPAVRGFGGRVFFYGAEEAKPIEVDGAVMIYAFDADGQDPTNQKPEKKYVFTADQVTAHLSQSRMGPSYSFWLPWDGVQGATRNLSLVVRYEGRDGAVVIAEPVSKLLPGSGDAQMKQLATKRSDAGPAVRQASHEVTHSSSVQPFGSAAGVVEETDAEQPVEAIDLPPSFLRRLQRSAEPDPAADADAVSSVSTPKPMATTQPASSDATRDSAWSMTPPAASGYAAPGWSQLQARSDRLRQAGDSRQAYFRSRQYPAQTRAASPQGDGPLRRGPHLAGWPSGLPPTPRSDWHRPADPTGSVTPQLETQSHWAAGSPSE